MPWTLKNVALDPAFTMKRRTATKMEMEPSLAGARIRLRQTVTVSDEMYKRNEVRISRLVSQGILTATSSAPAKKSTPPKTVAPEPPPALEPAPTPAPGPAPFPELVPPASVDEAEGDTPVEVPKAVAVRRRKSSKKGSK